MINWIKTIWSWIKSKIKWFLVAIGILGISVAATLPELTNEISLDKLTDKYEASTDIKADYVLEGTTLKATPKDDDKDRIEVWIGEKSDLELLGGKTNFEPKLTIARWDSEVEFSIVPKGLDLIETKDKNVKFKGDKIKFETPKVDYHLYELTEGEGGFEFEIILKEKPDTNVIEFTLVDKGIKYFYQPELTQEEINFGAFRPENIIGSYIVYASENKTNLVGGKEYKTGQVGIIYRPKATDAEGNWTWEELSIENGLLTIKIPQKFLDNAVYPIKSKGVNFGYETLGASSWGNDSYIGGNIWASGGAGEITEMWVGYVANWVSLAGESAIYKSSDKSKVAESDDLNVPQTVPATFFEHTISGEIEDADYYLVSNRNHYNLRLCYNDLDLNAQTQSYTYGSWPDTLNPSVVFTWTFSIYVTYTAGGEAPPEPQMQVIIIN